MFGRLPWSDLFQPAIRICEEGFYIENSLAKAINNSRDYIYNDTNLRYVSTVHAITPINAMRQPLIHSFNSYSASSIPLLLRSAPKITLILCGNFTPKRHRQLRVKDLPKVPTWRLEWDSNPRPSGYGIDSTNAPPRPTIHSLLSILTKSIRSHAVANIQLNLRQSA